MTGFCKGAMPVLFCLFAASLILTPGFTQQLAEEKLKQGMDYISKGLYDEAVKELTEAVESDPGNKDIYYNRAKAYQYLNNLSKALEDYTKAIELAPDDAELYYNRGIVYYYQDNIDEAIADWTKGIDMCGSCARIYHNRAFAYYKKEDYDKAWDDVHKIEELGYSVEENFLQKLRRYSGRDK